ncbi:MAG: hypothetical protein GEV11_25700 [Streptosporangiales bacterium]|nr:hypothetical protein [Streptosporangiales bacterium]
MRIRGLARAAVFLSVLLIALTGASGGASAAPARQAVLLGVPGLQWSDVNERDTPNLWRLSGAGAVGSLSVRTTRTQACPVDGWLTVSAGQRALPGGPVCVLPAPATADGAGAVVRGWAAFRRLNRQGKYGADVGLLGSSVRASGGCTAGVGPGGALAVADRAGRVDRYVPSVDRLTPEMLRACTLTAVDVDDVARAYVAAGVDTEGESGAAVSAGTRRAAVRSADRKVGTVLDRLPAGATVLVAGLADTGSRAHLHTAIATGPAPDGDGPYPATYLTSSATRRPALVTITDISPTLALAAGAETTGMVGAAWTDGGGRPDGTAAAVTELADEDVAAQAVSKLLPPYYIVLVGAQLLLYALATLALWRNWGGLAARRRRVLGLTRTIALFGAAAPVSTFLANLIPWWRTTHPLAAVIACVAGFAVLVVAVARLGPWRRRFFGPETVIVTVTAMVLGADIVTGGVLQMNSLTGYTPLVGGRYYGFGNQAHEVFAASSLLAVAGLAQLLPGRRSRGLLIAAAGLVVVAVNGWPGWGADFGGVIALVMAYAVLWLLATGRRVSIPRLAIFALIGAVVIGVISYLDYLRPAAERTHLGTFFGQVLSGEAWAIVLRKAGAMLNSLGNPLYTILVPVGIAFFVLVLLRPLHERTAALRLAIERTPMLRAGLIAVAVAAGVGFVMNDSGIVIPAMALVVAAPPAIAASVHALAPPSAPAER